MSKYTNSKQGYGKVSNMFLVDYDSIDADDTLDIHKCLMKKHDVK